MLLGQYPSNLDDKHALTIPKAFRGTFSEGAYITRGFDHNLMILNPQAFQAITRQAGALNIADPEARLLMRLILGNAARLEMDEAGHVQIPPELMAPASLEKEVVLVGQGEYCEVWSPVFWEQQTSKLLDTEANTGRFAQINLALE